MFQGDYWGGVPMFFVGWLISYEGYVVCCGEERLCFSFLFSGTYWNSGCSTVAGLRSILGERVGCVSC